VIGKHYNEIGFKAYLAYLKVDKIECLMTFIISRPVNRFSGQARLLDRSGQAKKIGQPFSSVYFFLMVNLLIVTLNLLFGQILKFTLVR